MGSTKADLDKRIERIHKLLEAMHTASADAHDEALVAAEPLLAKARKNHEEAIEHSRAARRVMREQRARRRRTRVG